VTVADKLKNAQQNLFRQDFGRSANRKIVNSTTDPRSVSAKTKQAQARCFKPSLSPPTRGRCLWRRSRLKPAASKFEPALAGLVSLDPDFSRGATSAASKTQPTSVGFVLLDPDFESGANRQVGNWASSTHPPTRGRWLQRRSRLKPAAQNPAPIATDPRSVSMETKQA